VQHSFPIILGKHIDEITCVETLRALPPKLPRTYWRIVINERIPKKIGLFVIDLKILISSLNFLALRKLKICMATKALKMTVKCLEGP